LRLLAAVGLLLACAAVAPRSSALNVGLQSADTDGDGVVSS
jgi:hypothetical protein